MKEGDYLSAKGPKVWPSCVLSMSDILPVQINWSAMSHDINKQKCPFWKAWSTALMQTGLGNLQRSDLVFHKVSTGCLHCKLRFGNFWKVACTICLLNLGVWRVGTLQLQAQSGQSLWHDCWRNWHYSHVPSMPPFLYTTSKMSLIMSWNEAWYALHKSTYEVYRFALYSIMHWGMTSSWELVCSW